MSVVDVPAHLTVDHLMAAIKQLSPAEWRELQGLLAEWQARHPGPEETEADLLAHIQENSCLSETDQRRLDHLRQTQQETALTAAEEAELQALWRRVEQMNVARLEALARLAQHRNTDVRTLMRELG